MHQWIPLTPRPTTMSACSPRPDGDHPHRGGLVPVIVAGTTLLLFWLPAAASAATRRTTTPSGACATASARGAPARTRSTRSRTRPPMDDQPATEEENSKSLFGRSNGPATPKSDGLTSNPLNGGSAALPVRGGGRGTGGSGSGAMPALSSTPPPSAAAAPSACAGIAKVAHRDCVNQRAPAASSP